jgi:hypothetical protein
VDGGISDRPGNVVDVFHTLFGIAGLSLMGYEGLQKVNEVYCLPAETVRRLGLEEYGICAVSALNCTDERDLSNMFIPNLAHRR